VSGSSVLTAIAATVLLATAVLAWKPVAAIAPESPARVTLVYVGAEDCPPCLAWQRSEGAAFQNSADFNRLSYREVKSPSLFDVLNDEFWPADLRGYRKAIGREAGVPLWLVVADDKVVMQQFGAAQWTKAVLPRIKSLLR
jgi:hypothetical protein